MDNSIEQFRCFSIGNCRGLYDRTAPLSRSRRGPRPPSSPGAGNSVAFLEPGWFIKLRELSLTFEAPGQLGARLPRRPPEPHARRPEPVDHHRLQRRGPRGQRLRAGQLRVLGLRVAGAGALLDRAPQRRLLRGTTPMTMLIPTRRRAWRRSLGLALHRRLRPARHRAAQHHRPRTHSTRPTAPSRSRLGALADFAFVKDGDGTETRGRPDPAGRPAVRRVRALHHAALRAGDRPAHDRPRQSEPARTSTATCTGPARAPSAPRDALQRSWSSPTATTEIAEMQAMAGFAYVYFGEDFCSGVPFSRVSGDSLIFGAPQTTQADVRDRARQVRLRAGAARAGGGRRHDHEPGDRGQGAGAARSRPVRRGRGRGRRRCRPSSSTSPSTPRARCSSRTPSVVHQPGAVVAVGPRGRRRAALPHGRRPARPGGQPRRRRRRLRRYGSRQPTPQYILVKYPDADRIGRRWRTASRPG